MSEWIRTAGSGNAWHRADALEVADRLEGVQDIRTTCGTVLAIRDGTEQWMEALIGPDDQHPSCRSRAMREAYWRSKWPGGLLPDVLYPLVNEAAPWLEGPRLGLPEDEPRVGSIVRIVANNLPEPVVGAGRPAGAAYADLLATLEAMAPDHSR